MRLFKALSIVDDFKGRGETTFNWFVIGRKEPVAPYDDLIENYDEGYEEAWVDQLRINELFTEAEIEELRAYLLRVHEIELQIEEVSLPIKPGGLSYGFLLMSGGSDFYLLADEKDYSLSLSVLAHFESERQEPSTPSAKEERPLTDKDMNVGVEFLNIVFNKLGITPPKHEALKNLLADIFNNYGFHVEQDRKNPE